MRKLDSVISDASVMLGEYEDDFIQASEDAAKEVIKNAINETKYEMADVLMPHILKVSEGVIKNAFQNRCHLFIDKYESETENIGLKIYISINDEEPIRASFSFGYILDEFMCLDFEEDEAFEILEAMKKEIDRTILKLKMSLDTSD